MSPTSEPSASATASLAGRCIVTLESRRATEIATMLRRHGAEVVTAPSLREVPLEDDSAAFDLLGALTRGEVDTLILLTGVGTRRLVAVLETRLPRAEIAKLLRRTAIVARGPKPVAALREIGVTPTLTAPEPNTWHEILAILDRELPVAGRCVAVQEYGRPSPELLDGLAERGAAVRRVPVYLWALPQDLEPLRTAIRLLSERRADILVFTSAVQLDHLLAVADEIPGRTESLLGALRDHVVVAAIGPTSRAALLAREIPVDIEPAHPKLGPLVAAIAAQVHAAIAKKRPAPA